MIGDRYALFVVERFADLGIYGDTVDEVVGAIVTMWASQNSKSLEGSGATLRDYRASRESADGGNDGL